MKGEIRLNNIIIDSDSVKYDFEATGDLGSFFNNAYDFFISYFLNSESITIKEVPKAVLAVPFVANVLPMVWLTDSTLIISELDEDFYNCLSLVKKGYMKMYPESTFGGKVIVKNLVKSDGLPNNYKTAMFYSGGADSAYTLLTHLQERPLMISVWGSDVGVDNEDGWDKVHSVVNQVASSYNIDSCTIKSSFRKFDKEFALDTVFSEQLKTGWWYGIKHGLALLGHVAPLAYLFGIENMYIASSNWPEIMPDRCASDPSIDNYVRFSGCRVFHDGFPLNRQEKIRYIVKACENRKKIPLHVCWESSGGTNCCMCEKCYRTMANLMAECANPYEYGFERFDEKRTGLEMQKLIYEKRRMGVHISDGWPLITKRFVENQKSIKNRVYWKSMRWILKADYNNPETIKCSLRDRLNAANGIRGKLAEFEFYQILHEWRVQMRELISVNRGGVNNPCRVFDFSYINAGGVAV